VLAPDVTTPADSDECFARPHDLAERGAVEVRHMNQIQQEPVMALRDEAIHRIEQPAFTQGDCRSSDA
jgi:hypothetical protein